MRKWALWNLDPPQLLDSTAYYDAGRSLVANIEDSVAQTSPDIREDGRLIHPEEEDKNGNKSPLLPPPFLEQSDYKL